MSPDSVEPQRRRRLYLDTSAYLCILLAEEGAARLSEETAGAELLSSVLLVLEARRNLIRLAREGTLKPDHYKTCMDRVEEDTTCFVLRDLTLDLAHLRTAISFHAAEHLERFVTLDGSQEQAAKELGLPV